MVQIDHNISDYYTPTTVSKREWEIRSLAQSPSETRLTVTEENTLVGTDLNSGRIVRFVSNTDTIESVEETYIKSTGIGIVAVRAIDTLEHVDAEHPYTKKHIPLDMISEADMEILNDTYHDYEWLHTADIRYQCVRGVLPHDEVHPIDLLIMSLRDSQSISSTHTEADVIQEITGCDREVIQERLSALLTGKQTEYRQALNDVIEETHDTAFRDQIR